MSLPPTAFATRVFFDECVASAQPLSEPGRARAHAFGAFGPGSETELMRFWDRTDAFIGLLRDHPTTLLEAHLKNCNGLWFLQEDPMSWGAVELARLHAVSSSCRWIRAQIADRLAQDFGAVADLGPILELLTPHCAGGGFQFAAEAGSELARERAQLAEATDRYLALEKDLREQVAARLGVSAARLKSDLTVPIEDDAKLQLYRAIGELAEITQHPHQVQFRFTPTQEAREAHTIMTRLRQRCHARETAQLADLCGRLAPLLPRLQQELAHVGELDLLFGRARWALALRAVRPRISDDGTLLAVDAMHPVIRDQVEGLDRQYQLLSFCLQPPVVSLTGANMGGKTAFLRTVGLLQTLFQLGYFIPAREFASRPVRSMAWVGAAPDSPVLGLSSFGRECRDLVEALQLETPQLLLVDEFARSTDVEDGLALTGALLDYLRDTRQGLFLFAGHQKRLVCASEDQIQYLHTGGLDFAAYTRNLEHLEAIPALAASMNYRIFDGRTDSSDALQIALALGVPEKLVRSARIILSARGEKTQDSI